MKDLSVLFQSQYKKANGTLDILEKRRAQVEFNLQSNPIFTILHKELRTVNLAKIIVISLLILYPSFYLHIPQKIKNL